MTSFVSHFTFPCAPAPSQLSHVVATKAAMMTGAIAARVGAPADWVRRCESRALRKLRRPDTLSMLRVHGESAQAFARAEAEALGELTARRKRPSPRR